MEYFPASILKWITLNGECWQWTGRTNGRYGIYAVREGKRTKNLYLHRMSFEIFNGPIPADLEIDHLCKNKLCCNPTHLQAVPHPVNVQRWWDTKEVCPVHGVKINHSHQRHAVSV